MLTIGTVFNIAGIILITGGLADRGRESFWERSGHWIHWHVLRPLGRAFATLWARVKVLWVRVRRKPVFKQGEGMTTSVSTSFATTWGVGDRVYPDQKTENAALWEAIVTLGKRADNLQREFDTKLDDAFTKEHGGASRLGWRYLTYYAIPGAAFCCAGAVFSLIGSGAR